MIKNILSVLTVLSLLLVTQSGLSAVPGLGTTADFVLFSTNGSVVNTGSTLLTGNVGTNNGSIGGFGNVNGGMHNADGVTASAAGDLLNAYNLLNAAIPVFFPAPLLGNGQTLTAGIYSIGESASLTNVLYLDAQGNESAEFIVKINGAFSTATLSEVVLLNKARACNVFWMVEGLVDMASGTQMKGNLIVNNAAIVMGSGVKLEGRALTTTGAITVDGVSAFTPVGCGSPVLTGPLAPDLKSVSCYALFTANGGLTNSGITMVKGDVGTNVGLTAGFQALNVTGAIHPIPDVSTAAATADLLVLHTYLNTLTHDIELLYPAQFGNNLELTPHVYLLNSATVFTGSVYLNALGNANAVFVIKVNGALSTGTYSKVILTNGAQAKNVYWVVSGALEINDYSEFAGVVVVDNGAINIMTGTTLLGRALTTSGALSTYASTITMQTPCVNPVTSVGNPNSGDVALLIFNPQTQTIEIRFSEFTNRATAQFRLYDATGRLVLTTTLIQAHSSLHTTLAAGIYFYQLSGEPGVLAGKLRVY